MYSRYGKADLNIGFGHFFNPICVRQGCQILEVFALIKNMELCEATKFSSLWESKDLACIIENNLFWVMFEMELCMMIN